MLYHGDGYIINMSKANFVKPSQINNGEGMTPCVYFRFCNGDKHEVECESEEDAKKLVGEISKAVKKKWRSKNTNAPNAGRTLHPVSMGTALERAKEWLMNWSNMKNVILITAPDKSTEIYATLSHACRAYGWEHKELLRRTLPMNHEGYKIERKEVKREAK